MSEYRIDDLARAAGTTVRNVRAYQDKGLIPPPRRQGRVGWYSEDHLERLRLVGGLLDRGYSLQNIAELVGAFESGFDLSTVLGLSDAFAGPFSDEAAGYVTADELFVLFQGERGPVDADEVAESLAAAVDLGLVEPEGDRFRVPSPRLLHAGAELARAGVPLDALYDELRTLRADVDRVAARFVDLVATHVIGGSETELPPPEDIPAVAEVVQRIRPLAEMVVDAELARALEHHAHRRLAAVLTHLDEQTG